MVQLIELIYFDGCPNLEAARANLQQALEEANVPPKWREWEQSDADAPAYVQRHGSPTILVNGRDVTGAEVVVAAASCRADGAPSVEAIRAALEDAR